MDEFDSPLSIIRSLEEEEAAAPRRQPGSRRGPARKQAEFDSPMQGMSATTTAKAVGSKMRAGQYNRKTITIPAEQQQYIEEVVAAEISMSGLETYRWLLDIALAHFEEGERPEAKTVVTKTVPKKKHWTSEQ